MLNRQANRLSFALISALYVLSLSCEQKPLPNKGINLDTIREIALLDRYSARGLLYQDIDRILKNQKDSVFIPSIGITAHLFFWGGEVGGPWTRIFCFSRDTPSQFQRQFIYEGEYAMSRMRAGRASTQIQAGENHSLGDQLTQLAKELGPEVYLNREKMKDLMIFTMENLAGCERIRKSFMDSLDFKKIGLEFTPNDELVETIKKVKVEMTINPDPNVVFFHGELTNGIWKGTVRLYDHTGLICIELDYLNGKYAYTMWM